MNMIREKMGRNKPLNIGPGFKSANEKPEQHTWFIKDEAGNIIAEGVGGTSLEAQNDLTAQLLADGFTDDEVRDLFKTFIEKGFWK